MQVGMRRLWVIGGGKGGVGKSFFAASTATVLARSGKSVIAVDADLGCPNLHTFLGIKSPSCTLLEHFSGRIDGKHLLLETSQPGLRMLTCAPPGIPGSANPVEDDKERIIRFIRSLDAESVVVDLGSGASFTVLDLFNMTDEGIVVASPDPASMQNVYAFIKGAIVRRIQRAFGSNPAVSEALLEFQGNHDSKPRTMLDFYDVLCTTEPALAERVAAVVDAFRPLMVINMADSQ